MSTTNRISEVKELLAAGYHSGATTEQNTTFASVGAFHRWSVEIHVIDVGTSLDADVEVATSSGGADLATLSGKSITQLTQAGGDDASSVLIEGRNEELTIAGVHHDYLRVETTPSGASTYVVLVYGCEPRYAPVSTSLYDEVVD